MSYSGEQKRAYQRAWMERRRQEFFEGKSCVLCGSTDRMEVDHVDPNTKLLNPAKLWGMSRTNPKRIAELAKCQVLCYACHLAKSKEETLNKQFCVNGHDTFITGRDVQHRCRQCRVENEYPAYNERRGK